MAVKIIIPMNKIIATAMIVPFLLVGTALPTRATTGHAEGRSDKIAPASLFSSPIATALDDARRSMQRPADPALDAKAQYLESFLSEAASAISGTAPEKLFEAVALLRTRAVQVVKDGDHADMRSDVFIDPFPFLDGTVVSSSGGNMVYFRAYLYGMSSRLWIFDPSRTPTDNLSSVGVPAPWRARGYYIQHTPQEFPSLIPLLRLSSDYLHEFMKMESLPGLKDTFFSGLAVKFANGLSALLIRARIRLAITAALIMAWFPVNLIQIALSRQGLDEWMTWLMAVVGTLFLMQPVAAIMSYLVIPLAKSVEWTFIAITAVLHYLTNFPIKGPYLLWRGFQLQQDMFRYLPNVDFDPTKPLKPQVPMPLLQSPPEAWQQDMHRASTGSKRALGSIIKNLDGSPSRVDKMIVRYARARRDYLDGKPFSAPDWEVTSRGITRRRVISWGIKGSLLLGLGYGAIRLSRRDAEGVRKVVTPPKAELTEEQRKGLAWVMKNIELEITKYYQRLKELKDPSEDSAYEMLTEHLHIITDSVLHYVHNEPEFRNLRDDDPEYGNKLWREVFPQYLERCGVVFRIYSWATYQGNERNAVPHVVLMELEKPGKVLVGTVDGQRAQWTLAMVRKIHIPPYSNWAGFTDEASFIVEGVQYIDVPRLRSQVRLAWERRAEFRAGYEALVRPGGVARVAHMGTAEALANLTQAMAERSIRAMGAPDDQTYFEAEMFDRYVASAQISAASIMIDLKALAGRVAMNGSMVASLEARGMVRELIHGPQPFAVLVRVFRGATKPEFNYVPSPARTLIGAIHPILSPSPRDLVAEIVLKDFLRKLEDIPAKPSMPTSAFSRILQLYKMNAAEVQALGRELHRRIRGNLENIIRHLDAAEESQKRSVRGLSKTTIPTAQTIIPFALGPEGPSERAPFPLVDQTPNFLDISL